MKPGFITPNKKAYDLGFDRIFKEAQNAAVSMGFKIEKVNEKKGLINARHEYDILPNYYENLHDGIVVEELDETMTIIVKGKMDKTIVQTDVKTRIVQPDDVQCEFFESLDMRLPAPPPQKNPEDDLPWEHE